jgi:WD40 repeat protein
VGRTPAASPETEPRQVPALTRSRIPVLSKHAAATEQGPNKLSTRASRLHSTHTGQPLATLTGHTNAVSAVAFSPDGTRVAAGLAG